MHDRRTWEKILLRKVLAATEAEVPGAKSPRLRADLVDYLDEGSPDLLWLRDLYNVTFPGIDYARIRPLEPPTRRFGSIADYFELDTRRMRHLEAAVLQRSEPLRAFISNAPISVASSRLWRFRGIENDSIRAAAVIDAPSRRSMAIQGRTTEGAHDAQKRRRGRACDEALRRSATRGERRPNYSAREGSRQNSTAIILRQISSARHPAPRALADTVNFARGCSHRRTRWGSH
jgi:hypothetical protein